jgi:putative SOS response-associated peptidase YedK
VCGRFFLSSSSAEIARAFELRAAPDLPPRYNIAPGQEIALVRRGRPERELALLRWGLVPSWARDPKLGARLLNARSESAAERPAFREALRRRRALVPANGFFEWQKARRSSRPFAVRVRAGSLFAMAALWERWRGRGGESLETCAILTTEANERVRPIHDRMPVILAPEHYAAWLDPDATEPEIRALLRPCPAEWIDLHPVERLVNDVRRDGPDLIEPARDLFSEA